MKAVRVIARIVWLETIRRKDAYVLGILLVALILAVGSLDAFGLKGSTRHILDLGLLMAWVFSATLAVTIGSRQLPREEERGTIIALLSKPMTRWEWLCGKALGCWLAVSAATTCFYLLILVLVAYTGGRVAPSVAFQAWILHLAALAVLTSLSLCLSMRMTADAGLTLSFVFAAFLFFLLPAASHLALYSGTAAARVFGVLYYALPHLELFDLRIRLVHAWPPAPWGLVAGVFAYGICWTGVWLALAWLGFRHRMFHRKTA
jgi:ABC-type transport system involved in multi-copper enzyme maturation permease subunit